MPRNIISLSPLLLSAMLLLVSCGGRRHGTVVTPWGEVAEETSSDTVSAASAGMSVENIVDCGEMIMLTMSGPDTYFDYRGRRMGTQYLVCEKFAQKLGVSLRVEVCRDTTEMIRRLKNGDADLIAFLLPKETAVKNRLTPCGVMSLDGKSQWAVTAGNGSLADTLNKWLDKRLYAEVRKEERELFSGQSVKRHVYAPFLDRSNGVISKYDALFRRHAPTARWDWRLLAAQCYQESCFDPNARSWAGACGLMQIMPSTADHLGLARTSLFDPESSIEAAARYIAELTELFRDVPSAADRQCFVLASYNGGANHIKDAMALTRKNGGDPRRWAHVAPWILKLQRPEYYNDDVVKNGYMRGTETVDYVDRIRQRYSQYGGVKYTGKSVAGETENVAYPTGGMSPRRATKRYRYHI